MMFLFEMAPVSVWKQIILPDGKKVSAYATSFAKASEVKESFGGRRKLRLTQSVFSNR